MKSAQVDNRHKPGFLCRDIRHAWDHDGDAVLIEQNRQVKHFARTLICRRCETRRIDEYRVSRQALERVRTTYRYPEWYHVPGGISVEQVRLNLFKDLVMEKPSLSLVG